VHITNEIGQEGQVRHYCLACAARMDRPRPRPYRRLNRSAILILLGLSTLAFSLFADQIGFGRGRGFGWKQDIVLVVGLILLAGGTLVRASTLFVFGALLAILALLADLLRLGDVRGFGYKQQAGTVMGLLLIVAGVLRVRRQKHGRSK
jgi:hypothetical protein